MSTGHSFGAPGALLLVTLIVAGGCRAPDREADAAGTGRTGTGTAAAVHEGLLYGRVTMDDGTVYEGRLRWGGDEEALWSHDFNGFKPRNPWADHLREGERPRSPESVGAFGVEITWDREADLGRPFLARFGDIARIDTEGREIRVTLKSGAESVLDRFAADDLADGLRIWDAERGLVDIGEWRVRSVEFLSGPRSGDVPLPIHGTVHTTQGDFTGILQWDREAGLVTDTLVGHGPDGEIALPFEGIASIERRSPESSVATLVDGDERVLSGTRQVGAGNRGVYVDDARYGRVLVSWDAFQRVDFSPGPLGPGYDDFPRGGPLVGSVTTRSGERLAGRLVYDLDESETTETLDAPRRGVDYLIPFDRIASVELPGGGDGGPPARVTLTSGETLELERSGDLASGNGGLLVFGDGQARPRYVPWGEVSRIDFGG